MRSPLNVFADQDVRSAAAPDAVLASLPLSYAWGESPAGSVVIVSGAFDWPAAAGAALDAGGVAVIVVDPQSTEAEGLKERAAPLVLDTSWAPNPIVRDAGPIFQTALADADRLECRVVVGVGSRLATALVHQLTLIRALVGPVAPLHILTSSTSGYAAEGVAAGHPIDLSLVCSDAVHSRAEVRLLTGHGSVELILPAGNTAQPGRLIVTDSHGATLWPTRYESGHRATWRRVASLVSRHTSTDDIQEFTSDEATVRAAFLYAEG